MTDFVKFQEAEMAEAHITRRDALLVSAGLFSAATKHLREAAEANHATKMQALVQQYSEAAERANRFLATYLNEFVAYLEAEECHQSDEKGSRIDFNMPSGPVGPDSNLSGSKGTLRGSACHD